jgi:Tfp pilus assembly protein PilO
MDLDLKKNISGMDLPVIIKAHSHSLYEVVFLCIVIALFYWYILSPKKAEVSVQTTLLSQLQEQQKKWEDSRDQLKLLVQQLNNNKAQAIVLDEALPLNGKIINLHLLIEKLANDSGVTIGDISLTGSGDAVVAGDKALLANPYGPKRTLQKLTGAVYVVGTYPQLQALLQKLENYGRIMDITALDIQSAKDSQLSLKLIMNSYYFASAQ